AILVVLSGVATRRLPGVVRNVVAERAPHDIGDAALAAEPGERRAELGHPNLPAGTGTRRSSSRVTSAAARAARCPGEPAPCRHLASTAAPPAARCRSTAAFSARHGSHITPEMHAPPGAGTAGCSVVTAHLPA